MNLCVKTVNLSKLCMKCQTTIPNLKTCGYMVGQQKYTRKISSVRFEQLSTASIQLQDRKFSNSVDLCENAISDVKYEISHDDFKWVRRILPPSLIPEPPHHSNYPTPSGWSPPSETVPDLPYFVHRNRYHDIPVFEDKNGNGRVLTNIRKIEGDIWALERDLIEVVRPFVPYDPATRVHEVTRIISIKGRHRELILQFLLEQGF